MQKDLKARISIWLKKDTIKQLDKAADQDGRSRSLYLQQLLDKHFEALTPNKEARATKIPAMFG